MKAEIYYDWYDNVKTLITHQWISTEGRTQTSSAIRFNHKLVFKDYWRT